MLVSIITTVRNEERHLRALIDSLLVQEPPFEVIIVDAYSEDKTWDIAAEFASRHPDLVKAFRQGGTRGVGRNLGIENARGEALAFIDGDCIASPGWLRELRAGLRRAPIVAGRSVMMGYRPFAELARVELHQHGVDVTYPTANLLYRTDLARALLGFDPRFQAAEDIDLNYRAVTAGASIFFAEAAVVYARARDTFFGFFRQAYWNGYGRKQLTLKHGALWGHYSLQRFIIDYMSFWYLVRLGFGFLGYIVAKASENRGDFRNDDRGPVPHAALAPFV